MTDFDPGIRRTVAFLRSWLFEPTDSGDGCSKAEAIAEGDAEPVPHVHMNVHPSVMEAETVRLHELIGSIGIAVRPMALDPGPAIQLTFDPATGIAVLSLYGVDDRQIPATLGPCSTSSKPARARSATSSSSTTSGSPMPSRQPYASPPPKPRS